MRWFVGGVGGDYLTTRPLSALEAHQRLLSEGLDPASVEVVLYSKEDGGEVVPLTALNRAGEGYTRVLRYRVGGRVVWDRALKVDRLSLPDPVFAGSLPDSPPRALRVLTWNVLFDRYDKEIVRTEERVPRLLASIRSSDADLIGLQEVEAPFLRRLLQEPWVEQRYAVTDGPAASTVDPYGQVLLSRWPILGSEVHPLGEDKRLLVAEIDLGLDVSLRVMVVHLSSDRHDDAAERRAAQIRRMKQLLGDHPRCLVLGDVNQDEPLGLELDDAWRLARPEHPGFTWDPTCNSLCRAVTSSGRRRRLDRVMVRGFDVQSASLWGVDPGELPPSDHHGIVAEIAVPPVPRSSSVHAALVLPVPAAAAAVLEPFRRRYDPNRWRWRSHITLFHGPVDRAALAAFLVRVSTVTAGTSPLRVVLDRLDVWRQRWRSLLVAQPDEGSTAAIRALLRALAGGPWDHPSIDPHLTLARPADGVGVDVTGVRTVAQGALPQWFVADRVELWARDDAGPMLLRERFMLRGASVPRPGSFEDALSQDGIAVEPAIEAGIADRITSVLEIPAMVVGSSALAADLPESDVDLVVQTDDPQMARHRLSRAVGGRVSDREVPGLGFFSEVSGLPRWVDVAFLEPDAMGPLQELSAIQNAITDPGAYARALRTVKAWAVARQVDDPAWGFLGGLAWALAVASTAPEASDPDPAAWVIRTFEALARDEPIALGDLPVAPPSGPPPWVYASAPSGRGQIREILPACSRVLRDEVERALPLARDGVWSRLLTAAMPTSGPVLWLEIGARDGERLDAAVAWLRGRARTLLQSLSVPGAWVRPWTRPVPRRGGVVRIGVGVRNVPDATVETAVANLETEWARGDGRPDGATLSHQILRPTA